MAMQNLIPIEVSAGMSLGGSRIIDLVQRKANRVFIERTKQTPGSPVQSLLRLRQLFINFRGRING